ncbi:MAG TPA: papain-like cysteine protease family protein [Thermoanaerobaculia bacterium]|nr:papain-like cysteine protease family protein [Thermoanaerobaculia bacterium]
MNGCTRVLRACACAAVVIGLAGCCSPGPITGLPVTSHPQETGMWCWAGSGQMVMHYLGNNVDQCTQANNRFGRTDCPCAQCGPNPVANPPCVEGGWPQFEKYGFTSVHTTDAPLSWSTLRRELSQNSRCGKRPFAYTWHWNGGGGHMMAATGYVTLGGENYVSILDPWAPCVGDARILTYAAYVGGSGYTHWDDYYRVRKQ